MKIKIHSQGGIGNQLFQAAAAHRLAILYPQYKVFFVNANDPSEREFALSGFFSRCNHVNVSKRDDWFAWRVNRIYDRISKHIRVIKIMTKIFNFYSPILLNNEQSLDRVCAIIRSLRVRTLILRGFFQSTTYFEKDFECFNSSLKKYIMKKTSRKLIETQFTLLHARRGDYHNNFLMGPLGREYFVNSLNLIRPKDLSVIIHTDGEKEEFCNIDLEVPIDAENSFSKNPWDLLYDAFFANNFIGSNSTLSWWASYIMLHLNCNKSRIVMPSEWYRGTDARKFELLMTNWELVEARWWN
jgi:hypothetical protein